MKKHHSLKAIAALLILCILAITLTGCGSKNEKVLIFTSIEDYVLEDLSARLKEEFPKYDITLEYMSTGNHAAKLLAEGKSTDCDISFHLEYTYLTQLEREGLLADLSAYDSSIYCPDAVESACYLPQVRNGGAIVLNTKVLAEKGLPEPACYADLLKPEYKGLISMPSPKSSGTGYLFLKSLANSWGETEAFAYFDALTPNILQYTSSGSGPVNALVQGEVAVGLGLTPQAVLQISNGAPLKIVFFEEGSPFTFYGQAIIAGKETRACVKEVFDFLINTYGYELCEKFYPEQLFNNKTYTMENYPEHIAYADMSNNTIEEKTRLLDQWKY